jgi:hypothetical protein
MTPQPQPADRCPARPGAPGYLALAVAVHEAATKPGPLSARTAKAWSLRQRERQLRSGAFSRGTRRGGGGLASQRRSARPGTPR